VLRQVYKLRRDQSFYISRMMMLTQSCSEGVGRRGDSPLPVSPENLSRLYQEGRHNDNYNRCVCIITLSGAAAEWRESRGRTDRKSELGSRAPSTER